MAVVLVAVRQRSAVRVAAVVAWIGITAFTFFHAIPVERAEQAVLGDGMGDALQWIGLLSILAVSAAIVSVARRSSKGAVTPAAARLPA